MATARPFGNSRKFERPLNVYGYSKLLFDDVVRRTLPSATSQVVGLRYFNVYGPREQHKGRMASVAFHHFNQYRDSGKVRLFGEYGGYAPGQTGARFIHVDDVVAVNSGSSLIHRPAASLTWEPAAPRHSTRWRTRP